MMTDMRKKLGLLMPLVDSVRALPELKKIVLDVQESVEHMAEKYDEVLERVTKQHRDIADIKTRLATVEGSSSEKEVSDLKDLEQYNRRQNLEIHGMKWEENENLLSKIKKFGASLSLQQLAEEDIDGVHRLFAMRGKEVPILVRFVSRKTKDTWQAKAKELRENKSKVLFHDYVTPRKRHLLWMARRRADEMC